MTDQIVILDRIITFTRIYSKSKKNDIQDGLFSNSDQSQRYDFLACVDFIYILHISGLLEKMTSKDSRRAWAQNLLKWQQEDGWFKSLDEQNHSNYHSTAYALGGLSILEKYDNENYFQFLKPFHSLKKEIDSAEEINQVIKLSFKEKMHFWRGSHKVGGIPAIIGQVSEKNESAEKLLKMNNANQWMENWLKYYTSIVDQHTGMWVLTPGIVDYLFGLVLKLRHDPDLAKVGGAAHLYWIFTKMKCSYPNPKELVSYVTTRRPLDGLYEKYPYCLDFDANFILSRSIKILKNEEYGLKKNIVERLKSNRDAIIGYFMANEPKKWYSRAHPLPGALAALSEAESIVNPENNLWKDVFKIVWWL